MRKLFLVLLLAITVGGCVMPRTLSTVRRISRLFGSPFRGIAEHIHPKLLRPNYAEHLDQVYLQGGAVAPRKAFKDITTTEAHFATHTCIGLHGFLQRDPAASSTPVIRSIDLAFMKHNSTGVVKLHVHNADDDATQFATMRTFGTSDASNGTHVNFFDVGITGREVTNKNIPAYTAMIYMLDGDTRMLKTSGNQLSSTYFLWPIGIKAPTTVSFAEVNTGGSFQAGDSYAFAVSLCNRFVAPDTASLHDPGQEGNATFEPALPAASGTDQTYQTFTSGSANKAELTITVPNGNTVAGAEDDFWTHARLYRRKSEETTWKFVGNFNRHADYAETGDLATLTDLGSFQYKLTDLGPGGSDDYSVALSTGAYDYAPTRNNVPGGMHYFAAYRGRGFWASKYKRFVYYSDPVGALTGGNYEAISNEFLPPFKGTVSMLAAFQDSLVIGTPNTISPMRGNLSSHTNASVARTESIGVFFPDLDEFRVDFGPVENGTGSNVVADDLLYFVSARGMSVWTGSKVIDVSKALRAETGFTLSSTYMSSAMLAHDPEQHIVFFLVKDSSWSGASTVYCYHYRNIDPETRVGAWTAWGSSAFHKAGSSDSGIDQIAISKTTAGRQSLMMNRLHSTDSKVIVQRLETSTGNDDLGGFTWSWKSGRMDLGIPDRRKHFHYVTLQIKPIDTQLDVITYIDGAGAITASYSNLETDSVVSLKVPVGRAGYDLTLELQQTTTANVDFQLLGYEIDATVLDHH